LTPRRYSAAGAILRLTAAGKTVKEIARLEAVTTNAVRSVLSRYRRAGWVSPSVAPPNLISLSMKLDTEQRQRGGQPLTFEIVGVTP
jgi:hypothetical protein